jgi:hypothetical protein
MPHDPEVFKIKVKEIENTNLEWFSTHLSPLGNKNIFCYYFVLYTRNGVAVKFLNKELPNDIRTEIETAFAESDVQLNCSI